jgi:hypothetical protein
MSTPEPAFACDLSQLSAEQRAREKALLAHFKTLVTAITESADGYRFRVPASQEALRDVGELLALERLCCPFLEFALEVSAAPEAAIHIFGRDGAKPIIAAEFAP